MVPTEQELQKPSLAQLLHILVEVSNKVILTEEAIKKTIAAIHDTKVTAIKLSSQLELLEQNARALDKKRTSAEAELKFNQAKEDEKRKKLEFLENTKEFKSLNREIELLERQNKTNEEQVLLLWQECEVVTKNLEQEKTTTHTKLEELAQNLATYNTNLAQLKEEHKQLLEEKTIKTTLIPEEWLTRYNRMQASVQDPIVSLADNCCGGCFYTIVTQELARIKKGEVLLCRSCYRFLYFDAEKEQTPQKES